MTKQTNNKTQTKNPQQQKHHHPQTNRSNSLTQVVELRLFITTIFQMKRDNEEIRRDIKQNRIMHMKKF